MEDKFENIDNQFANAASDLSTLAGKVDQLPTKSYLDDKIAELEGGLITKLRKEDDKVNRLLEIMKQKSLLSESEVAELVGLQIFPK